MGVRSAIMPAIGLLLNQCWQWCLIRLILTSIQYNLKRAPYHIQSNTLSINQSILKSVRDLAQIHQTMSEYWSWSRLVMESRSMSRCPKSLTLWQSLYRCMVDKIRYRGSWSRVSRGTPSNMSWLANAFWHRESMQKRQISNSYSPLLVRQDWGIAPRWHTEAAGRGAHRGFIPLTSLESGVE